jgi:NADPH-dependent curcumin reductase CurA
MLGVSPQRYENSHRNLLAKCRYAVEELGRDACVNYQTQDLGRALKDACPAGIDVY